MCAPSFWGLSQGLPLCAVRMAALGVAQLCAALHSAVGREANPSSCRNPVLSKQPSWMYLQVAWGRGKGLPTSCGSAPQPLYITAHKGHGNVRKVCWAKGMRPPEALGWSGWPTEALLSLPTGRGDQYRGPPVISSGSFWMLWGSSVLLQRTGEENHTTLSPKPPACYSEEFFSFFLKNLVLCFRHPERRSVLMTAGRAHPPRDGLSDVSLVVVSCCLENMGVLHCPQHRGFKVMLQGQEVSPSTSCDTPGETQPATDASVCVHFWKYKCNNLTPHDPL